MLSEVAYHPSVPRHLQIQRVLRARIESGEWEGDRPIPTEMELLDEFGVSRTTIRGALGVLAREGLIVRHRGRGSFVRSRVRRAYDAARAARDRGRGAARGRRELHAAEPRRADPAKRSHAPLAAGVPARSFAHTPGHDPPVARGALAGHGDGQAAED